MAEPIPKDNRRVVLQRYPEGHVKEDDFEIKVVSLDPSSLADGDVLVQNLYLSVDPYMRNLMAANVNSYRAGYGLGELIPTYGIGKVLASKTPKFKKDEYVDGMLGLEEYSVVKADDLGKVDHNPKIPLSYYVGILGMPGQTAYFGLFDVGRIEDKPGGTIFVSAASGAVGQAVGQIAKMKGLHVVGSAGSDDKVKYLKEIGYDTAFNYKTAGNMQDALERHCPKGIDVNWENVGGETLDAALATMNPNGRIIMCGLIAQYQDKGPGQKNLFHVIAKRLTMQGFIVGDYKKDRLQFRKDMTAWLLEGKIKYREDVARGLEHTPKAFVGLFEGANFGKVVIQVQPDVKE